MYFIIYKDGGNYNTKNIKTIYQNKYIYTWIIIYINMGMNFKDFFNKEYTYAIIGASNSQDKYGFKIVKSLIDANFKVIPINPKEKEIYGIKCYKNLLDVKEK